MTDDDLYPIEWCVQPEALPMILVAAPAQRATMACLAVERGLLVDLSAIGQLTRVLPVDRLAPTPRPPAIEGQESLF